MITLIQGTCSAVQTEVYTQMCEESKPSEYFADKVQGRITTMKNPKRLTLYEAKYRGNLSAGEPDFSSML